MRDHAWANQVWVGSSLQILAIPFLSQSQDHSPITVHLFPLRFGAVARGAPSTSPISYHSRLGLKTPFSHTAIAQVWSGCYLS